MFSAILNTWQFNLIGYLALVTVFTQGYKLAVRNAQNDGAATILMQIIAGISVLAFMPFFAFTLPQGSRYWFLLLAASVFYALNDRLQTTSRKHLQVSTFSIANQLTPVFLIIIGLTIFREPVVATKLIGAFVILFANFLLVYKKGEVKINPYILVSFLASLAFSIAVSIDIGISNEFNLPFYIMLTLLIPAVMVAGVEKVSAKEVIAEYKAEVRKYYLLTGTAWGLLIIFSLRAFRFGAVTTIVPLQSTATIINVLIAYLLLKEKDDRFKKFVAACLIVTGVYLTVL